MVEACEWCRHWDDKNGCLLDVPEEDVRFCDRYQDAEET